MRFKSLPFFLLLTIILTGCFSTSPTQSSYESHTTPINSHEIETTIEAVAVTESAAPLPFTILYAGDDITRAMYEPATGTYLGAWLWHGISKPEFETTVDKKHAVFAMEMTLGNDFPTTWILQSIAAQAAPLIILQLPDTAAEDFPLVELTMFAHELGRFNLPVFIVFNPLPPGSNIQPEDYVLLFRYTRIIFRTYAPMAAFVWHSSDTSATPQCPMYPGHDMVDWVSISLTAPQGPEGFIYDITALLAPFYVSFQQYKPIMILPIGISHFSRRDYVYRVPQAAAEIMRVYETIKDSFPRVRLLVYANNGLTTPQGDDFSITREEVTIEAYRSAIADNHFISRLEPGGGEGPMWLLSPLRGYYHEGQVFIDREIVPAGLRRIPSAFVSEINERSYVEISAISGLEFVVDHARRVIFVTG